MKIQGIHYNIESEWNKFLKIEYFIENKLTKLLIWYFPTHF